MTEVEEEDVTLMLMWVPCGVKSELVATASAILRKMEREGANRIPIYGIHTCPRLLSLFCESKASQKTNLIV